MRRLVAALEAAFYRLPDLPLAWVVLSVLAALVLTLVALDLAVMTFFDPGGQGGWPPLGPWNTGGGGGGGGGGSW